MFRPSSRFYSCRCCSGDVNGDANVDCDGAAGVASLACCCCCCCLSFKLPHEDTHKHTDTRTHTHTHMLRFTLTRTRTHARIGIVKSYTALICVCVCVCDFVILLDGISMWTQPLCLDRAATATEAAAAAATEALNENCCLLFSAPCLQQTGITTTTLTGKATTSTNYSNIKGQKLQQQ